MYIGNLYTVSTDNPVTMFIFLIYSLALCWEKSFPMKFVSMKFVQLHYFYHRIFGEQKISCPPCPKVVEDMSPRPPLKLGL